MYIYYMSVTICTQNTLHPQVDSNNSTYNKYETKWILEAEPRRFSNSVHPSWQSKWVSKKVEFQKKKPQILLSLFQKHIGEENVWKNPTKSIFKIVILFGSKSKNLVWIGWVSWFCIHFSRSRQDPKHFHYTPSTNVQIDVLLLITKRKQF